LIAYWPKVITKGGGITGANGHVMDIMATCIDLGKANYPKSYKGRPLPTPEGHSLLPILQGTDCKGQQTMYWNRAGLWRAVREGKWKLVSPDYTMQYNPWRANRKGRAVQRPPSNPDTLWELYDMEDDRTEVRNLASEHPGRVRRMAEMYRRWAKRVSVR